MAPGPIATLETLQSPYPQVSSGKGSDTNYLASIGMKLSHQLSLDGKRYIGCWWRAHAINAHFLAVDLIVPNSRSGSGHRRRHSLNIQRSRKLPPALTRALETVCFSSAPRSAWAFKLILPTISGTVVASSFLEQRLVGCPLVRAVQGFLNPLATYQALQSTHDSSSLPDFANKCGGLIELETDNVARLQDASILLSSVDRELAARLNTPWVVSQPIDRKRIALVRGRPDMNAGGPVYRAVASLGIDLVIVDEPNHWLRPDTPENRAIREAFLETDMTEDEGVVDRIVKSVKDHHLPIHGIFTLSDNFFVAVSRAATILGLPTSPPEAYQISTDKYLSRQLQQSSGTARVSSVAELKDLIGGATASDGDLHPQFTPSFPMIVKPTKGWSSECVAKVNTLEDLYWAVDQACARHGDSRACVIEPFFSGPEVDANVVLLDGEVLFSEVADEPPCDAESPDATVANTFSSVSLMLPSTLPQDEQRRITNTIRDLVVKAGFRTGVFHCEARMTNSKAEYRNVDGILDLQPKETSSPRLPVPEPACKLLEINARPPGFRVTLPTLHTYGVNYFQAHALASVGDHTRLAVLARAFDFSSAAAGSPHVHPQAQCWSQLVYMTSPGSGVVRSSKDACVELLERRPDLGRHVAMAWDYFHPGDRVTEMTDGARTYVAYLLVWTQEGGRRRVMELAEEVRREFCFDVEEEEED